MPKFLQDLLAQLKEIWSQLTGSQRLMIGAVLLATAVGMSGLVWFGTRPDWVTFRADLSGEEKSQALRVLEEAGVKLRVEGETLMIDASDRSIAEAALTRNGLGIGADALDGFGGLGGVTMTKDISREMLRRTRAREVEKALRANRSVIWAKVIYNNPERSLFVGGNGSLQPSASVVLSLRNSEYFRSAARQAVEITTKALGIDRSMVTINSTDGQTYSDGGMSGGGDAASDLLSLEMRHSSVLTAKAQMALERLYPGKTMVSATVKYTNEITSKREKIVPTEKVLREKTTFKSSSKEGKRIAGGDPSVGSLAGGSSAVSNGVGGGGSETSESKTQEVYESDLGTKETRALGPDVESISVSLAIDKSLEGERDQITKLVENAVGWKKGRDNPVVAAVTTFPSMDDGGEGDSAVLDMVKEYGSPAAQILSVLIVLLFLRGLLKKQKGEPMPQQTAAISSEEEDDPGKQIRRLRREIEKVVSSDPGSVSRLLESWLRDKAKAS